MRHAQRIARSAKVHTAESAAGKKYVAALAALPVKALARALEPTLRAHLAELKGVLARRKKPAERLDIVWTTNAPSRAELRLDDKATGLRLDLSAIVALPSRPRFVGVDGDTLRYLTSLKLAEVLAVAFERLHDEVVALQRAPLTCRSFNTALGAPALFFGEGDDD
jgi:hypothetical protein